MATNTPVSASSASASGTGRFQISNGRILDPSGNAWIAAGINIDSDQLSQVMSAATPLKTLFPGITMIRVATSGYPSASSFDQAAAWAASQGIVLEIEDHPWPGPLAYTGSALTTETNWYASLATRFANNPYVWFGTMNEPQGSASGYNVKDIVAQEAATYNAIRGAGDQNPILLEAGIGGGNPGTVGIDAPGADPTPFLSMHGVIWDYHLYPWISSAVLGSYSTNVTTLTNMLAGSVSGGYGIAAAQSIKSADGVVPVIVGEYGGNVDDQTNAPNSAQWLQAVTANYATYGGSGFLAWAWDPSPPPNDILNLTNGSSGLTAWGRTVAAEIAAAKASVAPPITPPPITVPPVIPPTSPQQITTISGESLKDAVGNTWTLTSTGIVQENGTAVPNGAGTKAFAIVNNTYYGQDATSGSWYTYSTSSQSWASASAPTLTTTPPITPPPITIPPVIAPTSPQQITTTSGGSLKDAAGNVWTLTSGGVVQQNGVAVPDGAGTKAFAIVNNLLYGQDATSGSWYTYSTGSQSWASASAPTLTAPASNDTLTLRMSEDAYQGDAQFTVQVDGKQVGGTMTASALHATGASNVFVLTGSWGSGLHDVKIQFLNDAYGGSAATDRNLYVNSLAYDGVTYANSAASLMSAGTHDIPVAGTTPTATAPADVLTLHLSESAWNGDALFALTIDGKQITTPQAVTISHSSGQWQDFAFAGNFAAGSHQIGVQFTNPASGGTAATQRTLYADGIDIDGHHYGTSVSTLTGNGSAMFTAMTTS
jgi:Cellulase (glycosyl hydrolase family 5)/Ca-dependent carbohydrate-binding module xylan-binding